MKISKKLLSMFVALCILATSMCIPVGASNEDTTADEINFVKNELLVTISNELYNGTAACDAITEMVESKLSLNAEFGVETFPGQPVGNNSSTYKVSLINELNAEADILEICENINSSTTSMYAEPNYVFEFTDCSSTEQSEFEATFGSIGTAPDWHLRDTWSKEALTISEKKGDDVLVAVIDSGCNINHEHLQDNIISFSDGIEDPNAIYHGINLTGTEKLDYNEYDITDNYGHGTAVASVISGANSNGSFTGVARNSKIVPIKISDQKTFDTTVILNAIYAVDYYNNHIATIPGNNPQKITVVNMSFSFKQARGYKNNPSCLKIALDKLAQSCVIVAAAGNDREGTNGFFCNFPAAYDSVIGVMAYAPDMKLARYSNYNNVGSFYEVAAPGTYIKAANFADNDGYGYLSGTSFATPIVAGAVALYLSNFPDATIERVIEDLLNSMVDTVEPYYSNDFSHYKLNVVDFLNLGLLDENGMYSETSDGTLWTYSHNDRNLSFVGYEEIWDYDPGDAPWYRFRNLTNSCTISDDFLYVGCYALYNFNKMENLTIGSNVEYIGDYACYSCEKLEAINIPQSVTELGVSAFAKCYSATTLTLPPVIEYYNSSIFEDCSSLTTVLIPNGWTQIPIATFLNCTSLSFIALPDTLTKISSSAFKNCSSLSYISLPNSLEHIGTNAFVNCTSLTSVVIPRNVTRIDSSAFSGCSNLLNITLYDNISTMRTKIFKDCPNVVVKAYIESTALDYALENNIAYEIIYRLNPAQSSNILIDRSEFETTGTFEITGLPLYVSIGTFEEQFVSLDNGFTLSYEGLVSGYITQGTVIKVLKGAEIKETYIVD